MQFCTPQTVLTTCPVVCSLPCSCPPLCSAEQTARSLHCWIRCYRLKWVFPVLTMISRLSAMLFRLLLLTLITALCVADRHIISDPSPNRGTTISALPV